MTNTSEAGRRIPLYERWRWQIFAITWLAYAGFYLTRKSFSVAKIGIGEGTSIGAGSVIGDYVRIGGHCVLHARVTLYHEVTLGNQVVLHSGCVIGADGFGYVLTAGDA